MSSPKPDTRTRILQSTWDLVEKQQGRGVRMSDIAKAAGITRQALYLHFASRADLLVATARYGDEVRGLDRRLERYRSASDGLEMVEAFIAFWADYIPEIYGLGKALLAVQDTDEAAAAAWRDRMTAIRNACARMVDALAEESRLAPEWTRDQAVDVFWTLLSVRTWEGLTAECGWSTRQYAERMQTLVKRALVREAGESEQGASRSSSAGGGAKRFSAESARNSPRRSRRPRRPPRQHRLRVAHVATVEITERRGRSPHHPAVDGRQPAMGAGATRPAGGGDGRSTAQGVPASAGPGILVV